MAEKFVELDLSRNQVTLGKGANGKDYARVIAPGGGTFLFSPSHIHARDENPGRLYISLPEGSEIQVQYSRVEHSNSRFLSDEFVNETKTWKIEDLKAAYDEERRAFYQENSEFVNMTVPTKWGRSVTSEKGNFISVSIPIDHKYYSFVVQADRFKASDKNEGMSYFGFPRKKQDTGEDYLITLRNSKKQEDGSYVNTDMQISSVELKKRVDDAVAYSDFKDKMVSVEISEKLVRFFTAKDGKELVSVSVPVYAEQEKKEVFYEIVVASKRVKNLENGKVRLSMFKNGSEGTPYTFTASRSIANDAGGYDKVDLKLTSEEVANCFNASAERFKNEHTSHTLADEIGGAAQNQEQAQQPSFRRHGR